jgi:hypothetical protein
MFTSTANGTLRIQGPGTATSPALLGLDNERPCPGHIHHEVKDYQIHPQFVSKLKIQIACSHLDFQFHEALFHPSCYLASGEAKGYEWTSQL